MGWEVKGKRGGKERKDFLRKRKKWEDGEILEKAGF